MDWNQASTSGNLGITPQAIGQTAPNLRGFHYKPLDPSVDCIRLLALYPYHKRRPETITCKLFHVRFSDKPRYEALSYTWGGSNPTEFIMLDGEPFAIQRNLYDALYDLRLIGNMPRMLWADAICIDQRNLDERKRQVGLMDYIYIRASTVLIWLGCGTADVENTFNKIFQNPTFEDPKYYSRICLGCGTEQKKYCEWVCKRSYWTRLWVIQEIGLSKDLRVCIGRSSRPWDTFLRCLNHHRHDSDFDYAYGLINNLDEKRKGRHRSENGLEKLLEDFKYAGCKDPRDKIYGLLGLAHDCQDGSIGVDHTKPLFGLYTDVLKWFCQSQPVPILCDAKSFQDWGATRAYDRAMRVVRFSHLVQSLLGFPLCPEIVTHVRFFCHSRRRRDNSSFRPYIRGDLFIEHTL
jgi:hypothetical protein